MCVQLWESFILLTSAHASWWLGDYYKKNTLYTQSPGFTTVSLTGDTGACECIMVLEYIAIVWGVRTVFLGIYANSLWLAYIVLTAAQHG